METRINKLSEIDRRNPFTVPENYFSRFNEHIMTCLPENKIEKTKKVSLWGKTKPWVYMAAMFMGIFFIIQLLTKDAANQAVTLSSTQFTDDYWSTVQITEEEFSQYLEEQLVNDGYYDYMYNQIYTN